jgi:hypothetical protein
MPSDVLRRFLAFLEGLSGPTPETEALIVRKREQLAALDREAA